MHFEPTDLANVNADVAMLCASYEARCVRVAEDLKRSGFEGKVLVFYCDDIGVAETGSRLDRIVDMFPGRCDVVPVKTSDSSRIIAEARRIRGVKRLLIDVSCLNRENLFTLFWASRLGIEEFPDVVFGYSRPDRYGAWLSRDYGTAHNIVGFPGGADSLAQRHLLCCVGYEADRAIAVIQALEPSSVTLVFGSVPTREEFLARNREAVREVIGSFRFDVREMNVVDPNACLDDLRGLLQDTDRSASLHIAPFNTKLSCLSIYALWLERRDLRIWNAQPATYNFSDYSQGSTEPTYHKVSWGNELGASTIGGMS